MAPTIHQQRCIQDTFGIPTAMVAGAGSGKTDTLTRRIAYALQHPEESGVTDINQILAITYTNKAAGELKARIKQILEEEATLENGLRDQALKVDGAWISTIHGMCSRILRENALMFGIDPAFTLIQDEVLDALIEEAIGAVIMQALYNPSSLEETELLQEYGRDKLSEFLQVILKQLADSAEDDFFDRFVLPEPQDSVELLLGLVLDTQEILQRIEDRFNGPKSKQPKTKETNYYNRARVAVANVLGLGSQEVSVQELISATVSNERLEELRKLDMSSLLSMVAGFPKLDGSLGVSKTPLETTGLLPGVSLAQAPLGIRLNAGSRYLPSLLHLARQTANYFTSLKRERGYVDNSDLLALVAAKLKDPKFTAISERYTNQFKLVMVDEFQDTNQMQVDMINLVAGGSSNELSEKMCVVGDAQQSIYRFNGADLSVFTDYVQRVKDNKNGSVIELGDNFRSHAEILAFCKGVFTPVFGDNYLDLLHGRDEEKAFAQAPYHGAVEGESASIPRRVNVKTLKPPKGCSLTQMAAQEIARDFKELVDRGNRPNEMAILLGTMKNASVYAQALQDAGLKCAITGGSVFSDSVDVLLMVDLCSALLNPYDTQALANVLTSDLFCLSADDLLMLVNLREGKRGSLTDVFVYDSGEGQNDALLVDSLPEGASALLRHAVSVLRNAMRGIGEHSLSDMVSQVLVESGWLHRQQNEGLGRAGNAFKALRILRQIQVESPAIGFGIIQQFRDRLNVAKEAPGVLSTEGDEFVRIMTIHSSKGLSIPIVAVAATENRSEKRTTLSSYSQRGKTYLALDLGKSLDGFDKNSFLVDSVNTCFDYYSKIATQRNAFDTLEQFEKNSHATQKIISYYGAIRFLNNQNNLEERQRLLYVAFTRAKEALIVTHRALSDSSTKQACSNPTVTEAIADLVGSQAPIQTESSENDCGSGIAASTTDLIQLQTHYPDAPEYNLDWQLRYQYVTAQDKSSSEGTLDDVLEGEEVKTDVCAVPGTNVDQEIISSITETFADLETAEIAIEVPLLDQASTHGRLIPYRAQWAEGVVSASSLKNARGEYLEDIDDELIDPSAVEVIHVAQSFGSDEDDATDAPASATYRGTAFHALCEWVVTHHVQGEPLCMPSAERVRAMARLYGLNAHQEESLQVAFSRWMASAAARTAVEHASIKAEQPFWVQLRPAQEGSEPLILQGFIDLLCSDRPYEGQAYVVDYKTGTGYNTDVKRRHAYELQAMCYAYALLKQGFTDVQLDFVFVDQPSPDNPDEPVIVHFPAPDNQPWTADALQARILETL